jgi:hypothetical protein
MIRSTSLATLLLSVSVVAQPPARGHALPEVIAGVDAFTPGERFLRTLTPPTRAELEKSGQVVLASPGGSSRDGLIHAVLRFDRPLDETFAILTQPSTQATWLPHVTQSKTVGEHTTEGEADDLVVSCFFTFRFRVQHWFYAQEHRIEWALDPTGEDGLRDQTGYFQLYALDDKTTIAEYGIRVVAKDGFLNFLRSLGERGGVAEALAATRTHVAKAKP